MTARVGLGPYPRGTSLPNVADCSVATRLGVDNDFIRCETVPSIRYRSTQIVVFEGIPN